MRGWEEGETSVEAGTAAWYWGAPLPGGELNATAFVDPGSGVDHELLLRQSKLLGPRLRDARRCSEVRVCDATPFVDASPVTSSYVKVGDAALAIDPLSSQGVQTAIGTALHAAAVLNTMMDRPGDTDLAIDFYRTRIRAAADFHAAAAADVYRRQVAAGGGDFWRARAPAPEPRASRGPLSPGARVALHPRLRFAPVPVASEAHIARQDGALLAGKAYAFIGKGVPVAAVLREIDGPAPAMEIVRRWSRSMPQAQALQVLQWAWSEGLVGPPDGG